MEPGVRGLAAGPRDPGPGAGDRLRPGLPHGEVRGYHRTPRPSSRSVAFTGPALGFEPLNYLSIPNTGLIKRQLLPWF